MTDDEQRLQSGLNVKLQLRVERLLEENQQWRGVAAELAARLWLVDNSDAAQIALKRFQELNKKS